ncbi:MAG: MFS transporter [Chloroflexota bacterium]
MSVSPAAATAVPKFAALHVPDYRRYFALGLLSMMADNIEHVISYWVIFQTFHSPALGGFAVISHWVPFLLFSLYTGALADRYDCRKLMQAGIALFMLASAAWGVLFLTGTLQVWHAVVILTIHGFAGVIIAPASQLVVHDMVAPAQLHSAIRLNATSRHLAILLGPAVGGALMLVFGPAWGLLVNVLIYLPFGILLAVMPYTGHLTRSVPRGGAPRFGFGDMLHAVAEVRADRRLATMVVLGGATSFFVGNAFQAQMPEYAHHLGADEAGGWYSVLLAGNAAGAVLGAILLESSGALRPTPRAAILCALAWGVSIGLFPVAQSYGVAVAVLLVAGMFNIAFMSMAQTLVQVLAPPQVRGRIVGLFNTAVLGLRAGSGLTVGVLGAIIGVHWSLMLSAGAVAAVAAWLAAREASAR